MVKAAAPSGWRTHCALGLVEFDNWGTCGRPGQPGQWPCLWGLDEIPWFANQPSAYRNTWPVYAVARIHWLDPDVYLTTNGLCGVVGLQESGRLYQVNVDRQAAVIPTIWAGQTEELTR